MYRSVIGSFCGKKAIFKYSWNLFQFTLYANVCNCALNYLQSNTETKFIFSFHTHFRTNQHNWNANAICFFIVSNVIWILNKAMKPQNVLKCRFLYKSNVTYLCETAAWSEVLKQSNECTKSERNFNGFQWMDKIGNLGFKRHFQSTIFF